MAIPTIRNTTAGGRFGEILGTGIGALAQAKLSELSDQYDKKKYRGLLSPLVGDKAAELISILPEEQRTLALQNIIEQQGQMSDDGIGSLLQPQQNTAPDYPGISRIFGDSNNNAPQKMDEVKQQPQQQNPIELKDIFKTPQQKIEEQKLKHKDLQSALKETEQYRSEVAERRRTAAQDLRVIKEMRDISDSGKVNSSKYIKALSVFGLDDVGALLTPESQQYRKLENFFFRNLKSIFGSQISLQEVKYYMRGIPTLMNTKEGRDRVFKDMEILARSSIIEGDTLDKLKQKVGKDPEKLRDLPSLVYKETNDRLNKLYEDNPFTKKSSGSFKDLPPAAQYKGKKIRDTQSGKVLQSNGSQWIPVE